MSNPSVSDTNNGPCDPNPNSGPSPAQQALQRAQEAATQRSASGPDRQATNQAAEEQDGPLRAFLVNWTIYGAVPVQATSRQEAERIVSRARLSSLLLHGMPNYELDCFEDVHSEPGLTEAQLNSLRADSLAALIGE